jgi:DNA polymerase-3 subunit beta
MDGERCILRSGKSRFTLSTLPATDFPAMEASDSLFTLDVPQRYLKGLLDRTSFAMAQQDVRYYLNGLLLEIEDNTLRTVATDGHRLALCEMGTEHNPPEGVRIIVPRKGVVELVRQLDDVDDLVTLEFGRSHLRVRMEELTFTTKLIDGKFPDYERVVPMDNRNVVTSDRGALREMIRRASILSNEKYRGIRLQMRPGVINALAHNPEQEEAEEELEVRYNGPELEIGFNASYLLDALSAIDSDVVYLRFADSSSSCLIDGEGDMMSRYVVMPMRL